MRLFLAVMDGMGIGAQPDAHLYGDQGADTLGHVLAQSGVRPPTLAQLGLYHIPGTSFYAPQGSCMGVCASMEETSPGKDTTTGHWEMAGCVLSTPFPTFPSGFPPAVIDVFCASTGRGALANCPASGTAVIEQWGAEHLKSGAYIVYTSADSVFQIAAHTDIVPLDELYDACRKARAILSGEFAVGRVIARPFTGPVGHFTRTADRRDFSLPPPEGHLLEHLQKSGVPVNAIGKISDIFAGSGVDTAIEAHGNHEVGRALLDAAKSGKDGFYMANLVDFDMLYGHRRDVPGYAEALMAADSMFADMIVHLRGDDLLIITADHGCDPAHAGSDHTREQVPVLITGPALATQGYIGHYQGFNHLAGTVAGWMGHPNPAYPELTI